MNYSATELRYWAANLIFLSKDLASFGPDAIGMIKQCTPHHHLTTQIIPILINMNSILRSSVNRVLYQKYRQILDSLNALVKDRVKLIKKEESALHSDIWGLASQTLPNDAKWISLVMCSAKFQDLFFECQAAAVHELDDAPKIAEDIEGFKRNLPESRQLLKGLHLVDEEGLDRLIESISEQFGAAQQQLAAKDFDALRKIVDRIQTLTTESAALIRKESA